MTFKISRTSDFVFDKSRPPCKNAVVRVEEKILDLLVYDGKQYRQVDSDKRIFKDVWTREINTLEELMELLSEVQQDDPSNALIILNEGEGFPEIEIYDSYR